MIKELVKDGPSSPPCEPATAADAEIAQDLVDTLLSIEDAACLAANQIGMTKAICALADDEGNTLVMCNPKVLFGMGASGPRRLPHPRGFRQGDSFRQIKVAYDELVDGEPSRASATVSGPPSSFSTCATTARAS
ncbi:MAG: peptide deformylase [Collinsella aerofaciens]